MQIHGISLVKDEVDVISHSLERATKWCDYIYVFDNGSTDGTWEVVQDLHRKFENIIPFRQEQRPFHNTLRTEVFNACKDRASSGDWWCKLDADEFYIDNPQRFLVRVPKQYDLVLGSSFQYKFTDKDLEEYERDPKHYEDRPVYDRLRYYLNDWSEPRFVRHEKSGIWDTGHPKAESVFPCRIWLKHYQYRSPEQIQRRLISRKKAAHEGAGFRHEISETWGASLRVQKNSENEAYGMSGQEWRERVVRSDLLYFDRFDGRFVPREDLLKPVPTRGLKKELHDVYSLLRDRVATRSQEVRTRLKM